MFVDFFIGDVEVVVFVFVLYAFAVAVEFFVRDFLLSEMVSSASTMIVFKFSFSSEKVFELTCVTIVMLFAQSRVCVWVWLCV